MLEMVFPVRGGCISIDHHYSLYAALSAIVPQFHEAARQLRFSTITGESDNNGQLRLTDHSCLRVRVPDDSIRLVLPLAGKRLDVMADALRLGVPSVRTLVPAPSLFARLVTFKNAVTHESFLDTARTKLAELGVMGEPQLPIHLDGERAGEPRRKIIRTKGVAIVGYSLIVAELSAEDSLTLQERGLGGRTQMGCGFFSPMKEGR